MVAKTQYLNHTLKSGEVISPNNVLPVSGTGEGIKLG